MKETEFERRVLDHGYIKLIDYMGSDDRVVFAARRSVNDGKEKKHRPDEDLIDYLIRNSHLSPLEHCQITFEVQMPIFVARQFMRHRTFKYSELSMRYSKPDEILYYVPTEERIVSAGGNNHISVQEDLTISVSDSIGEEMREQIESYKFLRDKLTWPSEIARIGLPEARYSNVLVTADLRNLLHFIRERISDHAQYEIRVYAEVLLELVSELFPVVTKAWKYHVLNSITLTVDEFNDLTDRVEIPNERLKRIFNEKNDAFRKKHGIV